MRYGVLAKQEAFDFDHKVNKSWFWDANKKYVKERDEI